MRVAEVGFGNRRIERNDAKILQVNSPSQALLSHPSHYLSKLYSALVGGREVADASRRRLSSDKSSDILHSFFIPARRRTDLVEFCSVEQGLVERGG